MNLGYYAHHHGTGHCRQADKLAGHLSAVHHTLRGTEHNLANSLTVFTSMSPNAYTFTQITAENIVRLPDEHETGEDVLPGRAGRYWQPQCLHYSPVGNHNIQRRSQILLSQVQARQIDLMIVDLSVEVALLCRTASIPYLYVRLPGDRNDFPHLNAFEGALALLAPYPEILESKNTPEWIRQKTLYLGFLNQTQPMTSREEFNEELIHLVKNAQPIPNINTNTDIEAATPTYNHNRQIVTVIKGFGGHKNVDAILPTLRDLLPNATIISLGPIEANAKAFVDIATQVDNVSPFLQHSDLLVMACGLNAIGEACQFDTPLLVVPDERPHAEQERMAQALIACGRAIDLEGLRAFLNHSEPSESMSVLNAQSGSILNYKSNDQSLAESDSHSFIESIAQADTVKTWFYEWVLPQLGIKPERQN